MPPDGDAEGGGPPGSGPRGPAKVPPSSGKPLLSNAGASENNVRRYVRRRSFKTGWLRPALQVLYDTKV